MHMAKNKVYVKINGSEYTITGEEAEDYLFLIARYLDRRIKETLTTNPKHSNTSAAVLTGLMITDELFKIKKENIELRKHMNEPEDRIKELESELENVKNEYMNLSSEYENFVKNINEEKEDIGTLQNAYNELYENYMKKNEEYENLLNDSLHMQEQIVNMEKDNADTKQRMRELKDELLESEIELVKINKELKEYKESYGKRNSI